MRFDFLMLILFQCPYTLHDCVMKGYPVSTYVLRSSGISRKWGALIVRYSLKKGTNFSCFLLFWESLNCRLLWNHWSDSGGVFSKMYLSKWALQSNRKLKMSHARLPTDFPRSRHICELNTLIQGWIMSSIHVHYNFDLEFLGSSNSSLSHVFVTCEKTINFAFLIL